MSSDSKVGSGSKPKVVKREVRFAVHIPETEHNEDTHYVKEAITLEDGRIVPNVRLIKNYKRNAWVTMENKRDHREKKEFEDIENLVSKMTTDSELNQAYASLLNQNHLMGRRDLIRESPYVYGYDVSAASFIKLESLQRNDFYQSNYSVCALDLETTVTDKVILMGSIAMRRNGKLHIRAGYVKSWLKDHHNPKEEIRKKYAELLPDYVNNTHLDIIEHEDDISVIRDLFLHANKWAPDFLSIWNLSFDIGEVILPALARAGIDPTEVLCDKRLPSHMRIFKYQPGRTQRVTASGKVFPIPFDEQWQKLEATTTFIIMDSMRAYRSLRVPFGRDPSYALDAILKKEKIDAKLRIIGAEDFLGVTWHIHMQKHFKIEYCIYNFVDNIRLIELDEKVNDLSVSLPIFAGITPFTEFASSSVKNYNNLFIYGLGKKRIIGVGVNTSKLYDKYRNDPSMEGTDVYDYDVLGLDDWIETLPQGNFIRQGLKIFRDYPYLITDARGNAVDEDCVASYPTCIMAANVSKETTYTEVIAIQGMEPEEFKPLNLGVIVGNTNTIEYCNEMFNVITLEEIHDKIYSGEINIHSFAANDVEGEEKKAA